jgi:transposase
VGFNFVGGDLDQGFLLPPDMREWLDPGDLAFFVLDAVAQFDLAEFTASYRRDGRGGAAYDPQMMVALVLFAYCEGVKSSRQIERRCRRDVAYRVLSRNQQPDHATIARFRDRHRVALRAVFVQVLRLCAEAGLVRVGLVALDGTKLRADASGLKNYDIDRADTAIGQVEKQIEELLTAAAGIDAAEDAAEQDKHDDPPAQLRQRQHRLAALRAAKDRLAAQAAEVQRVQDQRRADYDAARGKRGVRPAVKPTGRALAAARRTNLTDPDSRVMHIAGGLMQSFNAQAVVTSGQIVVAAEVVLQAVDYDAFHPMLDAARVALDQPGVNERSEPWWRMRATRRGTTVTMFEHRVTVRSPWSQCRPSVEISSLITRTGPTLDLAKTARSIARRDGSPTRPAAGSTPAARSSSNLCLAR